MVYKNFTDMPLVLEVGDLADTLAIGRNKAYELCHSGRLKILRVGQQIRIPRESFIEFLKEETKLPA